MLILAAALFATPYTVVRDGYGVPTIKAATIEAAYEGAGYAVAQDRLWQMEMSRRAAEGRLAEVLGPKFVASDKEVLTLGYAPQEIDQQVAALGLPAKAALRAYVKGVNEWIALATATHILPAGYAANGFAPAPWTLHDSAAVAIHLLREFGRGGAGEIRNLAVLDYLKARPAVGDKLLDVMDDIAWLQDPAATTTIAKADDPIKHPPVFAMPSRADTLAQLNALPKTNLFQLLPGLQIAERKVSRAAAERLGVPFYTGSYCVVVGPKLSATHQPLLLSGPQMGFTNPSIVHEIALQAPGLHVRGMDIPGAPGVVVGATPRFAWGLTSGVADVEDIFAFNKAGNQYLYDGKPESFTELKLTLPVKGADSQTIVQRRTRFGPVVIDTGTGVFALRSAFRGKELSTLNQFLALPQQTEAASLQRLIGQVPMSFNFFYAFGKGDFGYRYAGWVPIRGAHLDPRLPTPATPSSDWKGFIPANQMPHVLNPSAGYLVNWNNKPVSWWANGDTPVWGEIFRNSEILRSLGLPGHPRLTAADLQRTVKSIAQHDETWPYFAKYLHEGGQLAGYDGSLLEASGPATAYRFLFNRLRRELFLKTTGDFISPQYFELALQPTLMLRALEGKTHFDYLAGRKPVDLVKEAAEELSRIDLAAYHAGTIRVPNGQPILYSNRGTYIQLLEWVGHWRMRTILPPGESEAGAHLADQVELSRGFDFKPPVTP